MIKYIISAADIHIQNLRRHSEYQEQLTQFINQCKSFVEEHGDQEVRIVIAGDLLHNKLDISCEAYALCSWFLRQLDNIASTYVIAGNHDMNMQNLSRLDPLSLIFSLNKFKRVYFLDKVLNYQSGMIEDENIIWCLYSSFDKFAPINLENKDKDKTYVGLYHGVVTNATTDVGYVAEKGLPSSYFKDLDFVIMGDIHKYQCINTDGVPLVYCGSLIQRDHGENISGHGYVIWDVEEGTHKKVDMDNSEYGFYTFQVDGVETLTTNQETILNA